jgi:hypothetical protein
MYQIIFKKNLFYYNQFSLPPPKKEMKRYTPSSLMQTSLISHQSLAYFQKVPRLAQFKDSSENLNTS